ncbi:MULTISPECIES: endonuclease/exonuclease/phosphatase family protein [unclassified Pseudactinotalea]|uniref:endonuclease/exonuclease/phosphatase family protein n=1 Tax=Micrococcales TaxID=85006 RepID=UPI003C7A5D07
MTPLRVLSANIQSGLSAGGVPTTGPELAAAFTGIQTDVVVLQEVDRYQNRSNRIDQVAVIAEALGLPHHRYAAALAGNVRGLRWMADPIGEYPGPAYGVALASRFPITAWFATRLPQGVQRLPTLKGLRPGWWVHEPRVGLAAVLQGPDGPFAVACTHLSLLPPVAWRQLQTLLTGVDGLARRAIVAGDFNLPTRTVRKIAPDWHLPEALTFPAGTPLRQIDHILVRGGTTANTASHRLAVSDHRVLATEVEWA